MGSLDLSAAPRDQNGRLLLEQPVRDTVDQTVAEVMAAFGHQDAAVNSQEQQPSAQGQFRAQLRARLADPKRESLAAIVIGLAAMIGLIVLVVVIARLNREAQPAAAPAASVATAAPAAAAPLPTAAPAVPAAIPTFWAPGGQPGPQIDPRQIVKALARAGDTWVSVQVQGGGVVWLARATVPATIPLAGVPDINPTPAPVVIEQRVEVPVTPPCNGPDDIRFWTDTVKVTNDKGVAIGTAQGGSCYSQADAEQNLAATIAEMKASHK